MASHEAQEGAGEARGSAASQTTEGAPRLGVKESDDDTMTELYEPEWLRDYPSEQPMGPWAIGRWTKDGKFSGPIGVVPFPGGEVTLSPMTFATEEEAQASIDEMRTGEPCRYASLATYTPPFAIDRPLRLSRVTWVVALSNHYDGSRHLLYEGNDNTLARVSRYAALGKGNGRSYWRPLVDALVDGVEGQL